MFANTREFRREALRFEKQGYYINAPKGTLEFKEYWDEQIDRCMNGYSVAGTHITGYHYFYLNFCRIMLVHEEQMQSKEKNERIRGSRNESFPDFWDGDYEFFKAVDKAQDMGKHLIVLKARGKGYSFKNAAMLARNYFLIKKSKGYAYASDQAFLIGDGVLTKTWDYLNFIDQNTAWRKKRQYKDAAMHKRASYEDLDTGTEKGYKSEIIGLTLKHDVEKCRGKRGQLILWEEAGNFPDLKRAWGIARPSMEAGRVTFGTMIAFGTGGEEGASFESMNDMFYAPNGYNALAFENVWDEGGLGTQCGFFVPDYINLQGFIDKDGNSDVQGAREFEEHNRALLKAEANDPSTVDQHIAEHPFTPREATLNTHNNIFPQTMLLAHRSELSVSKRHKNIAMPGEFVYRDGKLTFVPNTTLNPVWKFPHAKGDDVTGCPVIWQMPHRINGRVPDGLYYAMHDPYAHDSTTGASLGATYIMKRINTFSQPDDMIVASYVGRPSTQDEYNRIMFELAEYYNAQICFENDRGDVLGYARRFKKLHLLAPELELLYNKDIAYTPRRGYGVMIGSGKNNRRKKQGELYLRDWLLTPRSKLENGEYKLNLHLINDIALLDELIKYNDDGNFDRVSAMIVGMFMDKELEWKQEQIIHEEEPEDSFWNRQYYA